MDDIFNKWQTWVIIFIILLIIIYLIWGRNFEDIPELPPPYEHPPPLEPQIPVFNVPYRSKGEEYTCRALGDLLQTEIQNGVRLEELKNPYTGRKLEIDCYTEINGIRVGAEYDGKQHREFVPAIQKTYDNFLIQVRNDRVKDELCAQSEIRLIRVPDYVDTCYFTPNGPKLNKKFTAAERYIRVRDYLSHHLPSILTENRYNDIPHYTTSYIP